MFTVLHQDNGIENLHPAAGVTYRSPLSSHGPRGVEVLRPIKGDGSFLIESGRVYVMNETGATVASYILPENSSNSDMAKAA